MKIVWIIVLLTLEPIYLNPIFSLGEIVGR